MECLKRCRVVLLSRKDVIAAVALSSPLFTMKATPPPFESPIEEKDTQLSGTMIGRRIPDPNSFISNTAAKHALFLSSSPFSTSNGFSGRGRGVGGFPSGPSRAEFPPGATGKSNLDESMLGSTESPPNGIGYGRGRPLTSNRVLPAISNVVESLKHAQSGIGRGRGATEPGLSRPSESHPFAVHPMNGIGRGQGSTNPGQSHHDAGPPKNQFTKLGEPGLSRPTMSHPDAGPPKIQFTMLGEPSLPSGISPKLPGLGRGKAVEPAVLTPEIKEQNRHLRNLKPSPTRLRPVHTRPKMSQEEAVKKAMSILSRGNDGAVEGDGRSLGRRGLQGERRSWETRQGRLDADKSPYLGENAGGQKLAQRPGVGQRVLPSPDAMDIGGAIEFEPEFLMGQLDQNPDIDEKPPMPVPDILEKVKPFIMAHEGIQSQKEWEEAVEEMMKNAPLLKEIVDHYSGPRVTAKKQEEELEAAAKCIPSGAPASVRRLTDRVILSLQSNPGWGFDKKYQFMDKLVRDVSQHYQ